MILLRKPLTLYDVDAAGIGVLALLLGVAWWGIATPLMHAGAQSDVARSAVKAAEESRRGARAALNTLVGDSAGLEALLAEFKDTIPTESRRSNVMADIVARATAAGVQVTSVTPLQPLRGERHVSIDTDLSVRSTPAALATFLTRLAAEFPYHSIEDLAISEARTGNASNSGNAPGTGGVDGECEIKLRLRLYMLVDAPNLASSPPPNAGATP
ncbi:MAG: hypothetical protein ACKVS9_16175 [Phycisphaerae bacterium]